MSDKTVIQNNGIGFCGALFLIFLTLKLTGYIAWSWWYVTMPLWIGLAVGTVIVVIACVLGLIAALIEWCQK